MGGELKNTICLTKDKHAFLSQHVGNLENLESYNFFEEAIDHLKEVLEIKPELIAHDLHPDYFSTKWALKQSGLPLVGVQHHHAHIASCMAENHLEGKVVGFALDGTGYGTDGHIWGGEVSVADFAVSSVQRTSNTFRSPAARLRFASRGGWRSAISAHCFGDDFFKMKFSVFGGDEPHEVHLALRVLTAASIRR